MPLALKFNQCGNNCQQEKWQSKPKPGCAGIWCSTEKQHNKAQITPSNFPKKLQEDGNVHVCELVTLKAAQSLQHIGLLNIIVFVYQIFASFP